MSDTDDTTQFPSSDVDTISMFPWAAPITAAACWWADLLRSQDMPSRRIGHRDEFANDPMAVGWMAMATHPANYSPEKVDRFEYLLRRLLHLRLLLKFGMAIVPDQYNFNLMLHCEYGPDGWIECAAKHAGINPEGLGLHLPWKTVMWIDPFEVVVREGRDAPRVHIFGYEAAAKRRERERWAWDNLPGYREAAFAKKEWLNEYPPEQQFDIWAGQAPINGEKQTDGGL